MGRENIFPRSGPKQGPQGLRVGRAGRPPPSAKETAAWFKLALPMPASCEVRTRSRKLLNRRTLKESFLCTVCDFISKCMSAFCNSSINDYLCVIVGFSV